MKELAIALFAILLLTAVVRADETSAKEIENYNNLASRLDPYKNEKPRPVVKDGHITPLGLQIHSSCLRYAALQGVDAETAKKRADELVLFAFKQVAVDCRSKYPELSPYFQEWISQLRRTVITCTKKKADEVHYGAKNPVASVSLFALLSADEYAGIDGNGLIGPTNRSKQPTVIFPSDTFSKAVGPSGAQMYDETLIHEVLHATHANNRHDHDEVERIERGKNGACGKDIALDRVNVIAYLCTKKPLSGSVLPVAAEIFAQTSQCGAQFCEKLFSGATEDRDLVEMIEDWYVPTEGLRPAAAKRLCARLYDEGACRYTLSKQGPAYTASNAELNRVGDKIRARLGELFPNQPVQLSAELFKLYPKAREAIMSSASQKCLDSVFDPRVVGNSLYVIGATPYRPAKPTPDEYAFEAISEARKRSWNPSCSDAEAGSLRQALNELYFELRHPFSSSAYSLLILPRFLHQAEHETAEPSGDEKRGKELARLIGPALYQEYLATLNRFHHRSLDFDCAAAGLHPSKTLSLFGLVAQSTRGPAQKCDLKK